jgi:type IV pilus assembly protein PilV
MKPVASRYAQCGYLMIEVLITMFILAIGLLGVVGLQARAEQAETDSYQRTQALILAQDMADRISANRAAAFDTTTSPYVVDPAAATPGEPLGTGSTRNCATPATTADIDLCAWSDALLGAAESYGGSCDTTSTSTRGANCAGTLLKARGCITSPAAHTYMIEVVWQGLTASAAPPSTVVCGQTLYGADEGFRRAVTTIVQIPDVSAP